VAKRVESTWTEGDKNINGMFMCVLAVLLWFKESKEKKQIIKREEYGEKKDETLKRRYL